MGTLLAPRSKAWGGGLRVEGPGFSLPSLQTVWFGPCSRLEWAGGDHPELQAVGRPHGTVLTRARGESTASRSPFLPKGKMGKEPVFSFARSLPPSISKGQKSVPRIAVAEAPLE